MIGTGDSLVWSETLVFTLTVNTHGLETGVPSVVSVADRRKFRKSSADGGIASGKGWAAAQESYPEGGVKFTKWCAPYPSGEALFNVNASRRVVSFAYP